MMNELAGNVRVLEIEQKPALSDEPSRQEDEVEIVTLEQNQSK